MDYAKAKQIIEEVAPELIVGADIGQPHINVHVTSGPPGAARISGPFSIMLPNSTEDVPLEPEDEQIMFIQAIQAAKRHLGA